MPRPDPFLPLTRHRRLAAQRDRLRETLLRPFRATRIDPRRSGPPNLMILAVDTLRQDHVHSSLAATPALDAFTCEGLVFDDVTAPAPWTLPSFTSALTGVMPTLHGAAMRGERRNMSIEAPDSLAEGTGTLADHLAGHGYRTAAIYSNPFVEFGLAESFEHHTYRNHACSAVAGRALDWIRRHGDRPFCCFVLFNDPHEPTLPPPRFWVSHLKGAGWSDRELRALSRWGDDDTVPHLGRIGDPPGERETAAMIVKRALYSGTVSAVDEAVGAVLQQLESWGLADGTLVSLLSDHGEEFLEHADAARAWNHDPRDLRGIGHGHTLFQELLHVPWLTRGPGVPQGQRIAAPVSLCDVAPTLCSWLGVPDFPVPSSSFEPLRGRALSVDDSDDPERILLSEDIAYGPDIVSVRRGSWKLIAHRGGAPLALFHLDDDPAELVDRKDSDTEVLAALTDQLNAWRRLARTDDGSGDNWASTDEDILKRLKDLGYSD